MEYKEIQECNKLIAEFMGGKITHSKEYEMPHGSHSTGVINYWDGIKCVPIDDYESAKTGIFGYNYSWDWLMPVVDKIEELDDSKMHYQWKDVDKENRSNFNGYEVDVNYRECRIWLNLELDPSKLITHIKGKTRIEAVFNAIVEFIKWHHKK